MTSGIVAVFIGLLFLVVAQYAHRLPWVGHGGRSARTRRTHLRFAGGIVILLGLLELTGIRNA